MPADMEKAMHEISEQKFPASASTKSLFLLADFRTVEGH